MKLAQVSLRLFGGAPALIVYLLTPAGQAPMQNLSGDWVLSTATTTGGGRSTAPGNSTSSGRHTPISSTAIGGAAFNCGRQCKIVQKGKTLTVQGALLGEDPAPAAAVTFSLDGKETGVVDVFNPQQKLTASARWNLKVLEVLTPPRYTQVISLESRQLVVVTTMNKIPDSQIVYKYDRK